MKLRTPMYICLLAGLLLGVGKLFAQSPELEKTYEITRKSKRGYLGNVDYDGGKGIYTLTYVTKSNDRRIKFEIYRFDKDFNFIDQTDDEIEMERAKTKYKWFLYSGDLYTVDGLSVEKNLLGTLVLKHKVITYKYDWFILGYYKDIDIKEKLKPKSDEGNKYFYMAHAEDESNGEALILAGIKDKADPMRQSKEFDVMRYNKDLDRLGLGNIKFDYPQTLMFSRKHTEAVEGQEEPRLTGMSFVFAPTGGPGMKKFADPNRNAYTFVQTNAKGEIVTNLKFTSPATYWQIDESVTTADGSTYLYGPSAEGKDGYANTLLGTTKFKAIQLMKVSPKGMLDYITSTNLEEIESKVKCPPSQKKTPTYEGKKFDIKGYFVDSRGDFYVYGQNYNLSLKDKEIRYNDVICMHFDGKGALKAQYGLDTRENNSIAKAFGAPQYCVEGAKTKSAYWVVTEIDGMREEIGMNVDANRKLLLYARIGKINAADGTISDFKDLGKVGKKNVYFLDNRFPYLPVDEGNKLVFFGSDKGGRNIWFSRVALD